MSKYLFPCSCGQKIPVEISQAGQKVQCSCGAVCELPTMLGLRRLERAEDRHEPTDRLSWGLRERLLFLGGTVFSVAIVWVIFLFLTRPVAPPLDPRASQVCRDVERMTLMQTTELWFHLTRGLSARPRRDELAYTQAQSAYYRWLGVAGGIALIGLGAIGAALMVPSRQPLAPTASAPPPQT